MKICCFGDAESIHVQRWVKYFADKGYDTHIISFKYSESLESVNNVHLHVLKRGLILEHINPYALQKIYKRAFLFNPLFALKQVKKLIKEIKPDILHGHSIVYHTVIGSLTNFHPFVVSAWGSDVLIYLKESKIIKYGVKFVLRKADLVTSDGVNSKEAMTNLGINPEKIKLIYYGVDTRLFNSKQKDKKLIKNLFCEEKIPVVISVRSLAPIYNVESLIKAIPLVLKYFPDAKFVVVGRGPQGNYLKKLAKSIGVWDSVRFIGWLPRNDFIRCLVSADIYVSTSLSDGGIAVSITEAMACELPVVVTDSGDNRKWIKDGKNGFIIPTKDPNALAKKIVYLIENDEIRKRFGKINRKIIEEKADFYKEMGKLEKLYKEIINKK